MHSFSFLFGPNNVSDEAPFQGTAALAGSSAFFRSANARCYAGLPVMNEPGSHR